jgi:hypothetical protein
MESVDEEALAGAKILFSANTKQESRFLHGGTAHACIFAPMSKNSIEGSPVRLAMSTTMVWSSTMPWWGIAETLG